MVQSEPTKVGTFREGQLEKAAASCSLVWIEYVVTIPAKWDQSNPASDLYRSQIAKELFLFFFFFLRQSLSSPSGYYGNLLYFTPRVFEQILFLLLHKKQACLVLPREVGAKKRFSRSLVHWYFQ